MIGILHGIPGGGKSYVALRDFIVEELLFGTRYLVLAYPLKLAELNEWIQRKHPGANVDLLKRVRILEPDEARKFYLYGPGVFQIEDRTNQEIKAGTYPDLTSRMASFPEGILYVIDEAHLYFDARAWTTVGYALSYYSSQHRKLNDTCVFITQHIDKLEKRLRLDAEQFIECINYGNRHMWTFFRLPRKIRTLTRYTYPGPVDRNTVAALDVELANCYDTTAGVGLTGLRKPEHRRKSGVAWWWLIPIACLAGWAVMAAPEWVARKLTGTLAEVVDKETANVSPPSSSSSNSSSVPAAVIAESKPGLSSAAATPSPAAPTVPALGPSLDGVDIVGWVTDGQRVRVSLSNGYTLSEDDPVMIGVKLRTNGMTLRDGRVYRVRPAPRATTGSPTPPPPSEGRETAKKEEKDGRDALDIMPHSAWVRDPDSVYRLRRSESGFAP